jgi:hypothetical protein
MSRASVLFVILAAVAAPFSLVGQQSDAARRGAIEAMYPVMIKALETGNFGQARNICDQAILWEPLNPVHHYNLACIEARAGGARLPFAMPALEKAAALGFYEIGTLKNDPDLDPIRNDPKFAEVAALIAKNAERKSRESFAAQAPQGGAASLPGTDAPVATPTDAAPVSGAGAKLPMLSDVAAPAASAFKEGVPVGLFFMTRFWSFTGTLEKLVWYFAPDGTVYQSLEHGFSTHDLATHAGPRGKAVLAGDRLEVTWSDGKKSSGGVERSATGFSWNGGIFTPVAAFDPAVPIAGTYEGGESLSYRGNRAALSKTLELRPDGTYRWSGVSFLSSMTDASRVEAGSNGTDSVGRWQASGFSLILIDASGNVYRRIAFPYDDTKTPVNPDRIFFGGTMFKRR